MEKTEFSFKTTFGIETTGIIDNQKLHFNKSGKSINLEILEDIVIELDIKDVANSLDHLLSCVFRIVADCINKNTEITTGLPGSQSLWEIKELINYLRKLEIKTKEEVVCKQCSQKDKEINEKDNDIRHKDERIKHLEFIDHYSNVIIDAYEKKFGTLSNKDFKPFK